MNQVIRLRTADGYSLGAVRFPAQVALKGHVIVAGATGVPQGFYRRFAEFASQQGYTTLTLDYRGIGLSKPETLVGFKMNLLDWGTLDLAAAVDYMARDDVPLYVVGHSYGGHAIGLLPNHQRIAGCYVFGTGAGWHGWMPPLESLRVRFMWRFVLAPLTRWKGYSPWKMLNAGEDLPIDVFNQWRHWCGFPHYFFDDPEMPDIAERFARIRLPIMAANALDDKWALPSSRDAFVQGYRNAVLTKVDLDPGARGIGHMGYFRPNARPLWDHVLEWFDSLQVKV